MQRLIRFLLTAMVPACAVGFAFSAPYGEPQKPAHHTPAPIVIKMRGHKVLVNSRVKTPARSRRPKTAKQPSGWQPGGPLKPLYQSAVQAVHARDFGRAEALCQQGLRLAKGDKAFTDLLAQIPSWRANTTQARITSIYTGAVALVRQGRFDDAEAACRQGLLIEPGNASFHGLLADIANKRNATLQRALLECYRAASTMMSQGHLPEAEARCREGLKLQPDDAVLKSLLKQIRERAGESGD